MRLVGVILARGGSKRLPGKNIRPLHGKPLIAYTIEAALGAPSLARVIVSTDDPAIAQVARDCGAEVPFLRPAALATDQSSSLDALAHAVDALEQADAPVDAVVLLQPTSPFRTARHIEDAVRLFRDTGVDTVTAVSAAPVHPYYCWREQGDEIAPYFSRREVAMERLDLPPALVENGAIYVVRRTLLRSGSLYGARIAGYQIDPAAALDIDTAEDFARAEAVMTEAAPAGHRNG
jgi:CMP-N-acetylneuraminic acid synthetase